MQDSQAPVLTVSILLKIDTLMHLYRALTQSLNFVKNTNLILDSDYKLVSLFYKVKIIYVENEKKYELPIFCKAVFRVDV
jgi:hypothetical protein